MCSLVLCNEDYFHSQNIAEEWIFCREKVHYSSFSSTYHTHVTIKSHLFCSRCVYRAINSKPTECSSTILIVVQVAILYWAYYNTAGVSITTQSYVALFHNECGVLTHCTDCSDCISCELHVYVLCMYLCLCTCSVLYTVLCWVIVWSVPENQLESARATTDDTTMKSFYCGILQYPNHSTITATCSKITTARDLIGQTWLTI